MDNVPLPDTLGKYINSPLIIIKKERWEELRKREKENIRCCITCGFDPEKRLGSDFWPTPFCMQCINSNQYKLTYKNWVE